jgi:hypothetical protein
MENVDINIPRIHVALENLQTNHQTLLMVESKATNQPISILIDSRASHIARDLVERFPLKRSMRNHGCFNWLPKLKGKLIRLSKVAHYIWMVSILWQT